MKTLVFYLHQVFLLFNELRLAAHLSLVSIIESLGHYSPQSFFKKNTRCQHCRAAGETASWRKKKVVQQHSECCSSTSSTYNHELHWLSCTALLRVGRRVHARHDPILLAILRAKYRKTASWQNASKMSKISKISPQTTIVRPFRARTSGLGTLRGQNFAPKIFFQKNLSQNYCSHGNPSKKRAKYRWTEQFESKISSSPWQNQVMPSTCSSCAGNFPH